MNDFAGMEDLLSDFLLEAGDMLSEVDSKLMDLEKFPEDSKLLNEIFRGFHTIKGGAGFLNATELVALCNITENVFDKLRNRELLLGPELMVALSAATAEVRTMFGSLQQNLQPSEAPRELIDALKAALAGQKSAFPATQSPFTTGSPGGVRSAGHDVADWDRLYKSLTGTENVAQAGVIDDPKIMAATIPGAESDKALPGNPAADIPALDAGRSEDDAAAQATAKPTMRVDTDRLDQLLNISGEIGLTKSRLTQLRSDIIQGRIDADTMHELDQSISQLETLVVNLQNAVIKTRMQPIGRLFKKYPPLVSNLAHSLGKDVELLLDGADAELDSALIEDLDEPLLNLLRNAVDMGVETVEERIAAGKPRRSIVELSAHQEGDHILITIADDGRGMRPELIRNKAIAKGLISSEAANSLEQNQCLELIFLPGFAGNDDKHGSITGLDVVKTNIQELNGTINIRSEPGKGTVINILLPLTLAILPVLILRLGEQSFAVPLSLASEILSVTPGKLQLVSGRPSMVVHGKVLPVLPLAQLIGWEQNGTPTVGVLVKSGNNHFVMSVDSVVGQDDVVVKPFDAFRPKGVAAVTMSSEGEIVLILDIKELISEARAH
ncbi:MAG: chemotaxis protein CheA [Pseudomonadota bacterium]